MLTIENPSYPNVYTFTKTGQRFAVYQKRKSGKFTPHFYVNDYSHQQRSYKSYDSREDAVTAATRVCELLPAKDVGKHQKIHDIVYGNNKPKFVRKEFIEKVARHLSTLSPTRIVTSYNIAEDMGLITKDKFYLDKMYQACSEIRRNPDKYGVITKDLGEPHRDFSFGGSGKRRSQPFRVLGS